MSQPAIAMLISSRPRRRPSCSRFALAKWFASVPGCAGALRDRSRQVPDFIALRGDASDRIPGAKGVGEKGAASILRRYGSLENAIAAGRFPTQAEKLRLYRLIATMDRSAPLPALADQRPTWDKAAALARDWQLKKLAERLEGLAER